MKEKQIDKQAVEEMARVICDDCRTRDTDPCKVKMCDAVLQNAEALYNAGYRKQSEWISVEERLPNKADWYLVYAENQRPFVAYFKGKTFPLNNHYHKITHWMPLPELPKMKGGVDETAEGTAKRYFTPEEVRKMTREEVRANYTAIMNSMKEWK